MLEELKSYGNWISISELSSVLGISQRTLYKYINSGYFPSFKFQGKRMFCVDDILFWLSSIGMIGDNDFKKD